MADMQFVPGEDKAKIVVYGLSTCGWCSKTKQYLAEKGVSYYFVDVDLLTKTDAKEVQQEIKRWNSQVSFPTIVINNEACIIGHNTKKLSEVIE